MQKKSDGEIFVRWREGENDETMRLMEELIKEYSNSLRRHVKYSTYADTHIADDVVQETWFRVLKNRFRYRVMENANFKTWFFKIGLNVKYRMLSKREDTSDTEMEDPRPSPRKALDSRNLKRDLDSCLKTLPDNQKQKSVFQLAIDGLLQKDIMELTGIRSRGTVWNRFNEATAWMRNCLVQKGWREPDVFSMLAASTVKEQPDDL